MSRRFRRVGKVKVGVDALESRLVLSGVSPLVRIGDTYVAQLQSGFADLATAYVNAAGTTLFAGGASGIAGNRAAFDTQVDGFIHDLESDLNAQLGLSPLAKVSLTSQIDDSLVGSTGLASTLTALASPTDTAGASSSTFGAAASADIANVLAADVALYRAFYNPNSALRQSVGDAGGGASALQLINNSYDTQLRKEYVALAASYASTANSSLFTEATVAGLQTARANFDNTVGGGVGDIISNLTAKLALQPGAATSGLTTKIQDALAGSGGLLSQLQALATPTNLTGQTAEAFGRGAATAISNNYHEVRRMLNDFFRSSSASLGLPLSTTSTAGSTSSGTGSTGSTSTGSGSTSTGSTSTGSGSTSGTTGTVGTGSGTSGTSSSGTTTTTTQSGTTIGASTDGFLTGFNSNIGSGFGSALDGGFSQNNNGTFGTGTVVSGVAGSAATTSSFNDFNDFTGSGTNGSGNTTSSSSGTGTTGLAGTGGTASSGGATSTTAGSTGFNTGFNSGINGTFGSGTSNSFGGNSLGSSEPTTGSTIGTTTGSTAAGSGSVAGF